jgi:hypothetical protein
MDADEPGEKQCSWRVTRGARLNQSKKLINNNSPQKRYFLVKIASVIENTKAITDSNGKLVGKNRQCVLALRNAGDSGPLHCKAKGRSICPHYLIKEPLNKRRL